MLSVVIVCCDRTVAATTLSASVMVKLEQFKSPYWVELFLYVLNICCRVGFSTGSGGIQSSGMGAERLRTNSGKSSCVS